MSRKPTARKSRQNNNDMKKVVLAADLGGTNLRMATVDSDGKIMHLDKKPTPRGVLPAQLVDQIRQMADDCCSPIGLRRGDLSGVGFTAPAPVAKDFDGFLTKLPNIPTLVGMNLKAELEKLFNLPVVIENDATAAGIGEDWIGASRGVENSICMTLGTGIGGGIIIGGEPLRGKDGTGGEIGPNGCEPDCHPCRRGRHARIWPSGSATAVTRMAREAGMEIENARQVFDALKNGDERADQVFRKMGRYLGIALAGLTNALNPEMLVICGGVTQGWEAFAGHIEDEMAIRAYAVAAARAKLVKGELGDNAGITGAARSAFLSLQ